MFTLPWMVIYICMMKVSLSILLFGYYKVKLHYKIYPHLGVINYDHLNNC